MCLQSPFRHVRYHIPGFWGWGCGHLGAVNVILPIMGGSTHSHTSLNQFVKQHNKAKTSCLCLERCIFSLEFSICASVFHSISSFIAVFVADRDRIRVHLTLQLLSWASITRTELRLQEAGMAVCGEQKADPRSELCIAFQDWSLGFLVCKTRRRKGSFNASKLSFSFYFPRVWCRVFLLCSPSYLSSELPAAMETCPQGPTSIILFSSLIFQFFLKLTSCHWFQYCPLDSFLAFLFSESPLGFRHSLISGAWLIWDMIPL